MKAMCDSVMNESEAKKSPVKKNVSTKRAVLGTYTHDIIHKYKEAKKEEIMKYLVCVSIPTKLFFVKSALNPHAKYTPKKMSQEITPSAPVVTAKVGKSPIPYVKSVFQKSVDVISFGLYESHAVTNVFGPEPNSGCVWIVWRAISNVTGSDGRTSTADILKKLCAWRASEFPKKRKPSDRTRKITE